MPVFKSNEITEALTSVPQWKVVDGALAREFSFGDFGEAMSFVNTVAGLAERAGHHPDIDIRYNKVALRLVSHDAGGITDKDFALAGQVDNTL